MKKTLGEGNPISAFIDMYIQFLMETGTDELLAAFRKGKTVQN